MHKRLHLLDALRGFTLIHMIAFHGLWNLVYLFGVEAAWYRGTPGYIWQQWICWTFILLSGFCWSLGRKHLKRGLLVFGSGALVSAVTLLAMPDSRILFGVLTCLGSCMLLLIPLERLLKKVSTPAGLILSFGLFVLLRNVPDRALGFEGWVICPLPRVLYRNLLTAYLGFPAPGFFSTDYFPLIPWFFLFVTGYFLYRILEERNLNQRLFGKGQVPLLNWMGRHSLLIYLLHQPILYGLCMLLF
jgi:uncharacterized membrane protein